MDAYIPGPAAASNSLLVERCVAGEQDAWRGLHRRHYARAMAVLRRLGVSPDQLEDACQDVFLDVFRYLPGFRHEADFQTWLYRICVSRARVARRRARVRSFLKNLLYESGREPVSQSLEQGQASRQLAKALERLPEAERVVFVLFELEGLSGAEIADVVRRPRATVFRQLHDARKRFAEVLEADEA